MQILRGYERQHSFNPGPIQPCGKPSGGPRRVLHASMTPLTNSDIVKRRRNPFIFRLLLYSLSTDIAAKRHGPRRLLRFLPCCGGGGGGRGGPPRKQLRTVNRPVTTSLLCLPSSRLLYFSVRISIREVFCDFYCQLEKVMSLGKFERRKKF